MGKILYDDVIRTRNEWEESLSALAKGSMDIKFPDLGDLPELNAVQSHYFAIFNNNPQDVVLQIRKQAKKKLGRWSPLVWDFSYSEGNSEFYRIDVPREMIIYRKGIYAPNSRWMENKSLHSKGQIAIRNLLGELNSGEI